MLQSNLDEYIDLKIDIFDHLGQHAKIHRSVTVATLIEEILHEFTDLSGPAENYGLYLCGSSEALERSYTLDQLGIKAWEELTCDYQQKVVRRPLPAHDRYYLKGEGMEALFPIEWQPAFIGRPTKDPEHDLRLAVNLANFPMGDTISRTHAQLTCRESVRYIERMAENNPVYLNGNELAYRTPQPLKWGDRIEIGRSRILLVVSKDPAEGNATKNVRVSKQAPDQPVGGPSVEQPYGKTKIGPIDEQGIPTMERPDAGLILVNADQKAMQDQLINKFYPIHEVPFMLGRQELGLSNESGVSRVHAEMTYDAGRGAYIIRDLNSRNGVSVNGRVLPQGETLALANQDQIRLGQLVVLSFKIV